MTEFRYSESEWQAIKCVVAKLGLDADRIGRGGASLRSLVEIAAGMYIEQADKHSDLNRRKAGGRARLETWKALRDQAETLRDAIDTVASPGLASLFNPDMRAAAEAYVRKLSHLIDIFENNRISIRDPIVPGSGRTKVPREYFWRELVELWCEFGGKPTGNAVEAFVDEAMAPVSDRMNDKRVTKQAIEQWFLRAKKQLR